MYKDEPRRILPTIDAEMKKRIDKADIVSKDKKDGIKKPPKVVSTINKKYNKIWVILLKGIIFS